MTYEDTGESPKRKNTTFPTQQKFEIKKWKYVYNLGKLKIQKYKIRVSLYFTLLLI